MVVGALLGKFSSEGQASTLAFSCSIVPEVILELF